MQVEKLLWPTYELINNFSFISTFAATEKNALRY